MKYIKLFENGSDFISGSTTYRATEVYITLSPLDNMEFDNIIEYPTDKFHVIDGTGKKILGTSFDKVYIHILNIENKERRDLFSKYHNEIQQYNNFVYQHRFDDDMKSQDGRGHGIYEFYWQIMYNKDTKKIIQPYLYETDRYIPQTIKDIITGLVK